MVVCEDPGLRESVASWLEAEGMEVLACPGPQAPGFECLGLRGCRCALEAAADIVVLDLHPEPRMHVDTTNRVALVQHYRTNLRPVVVMVDDSAPVLPEVEGVAMVGRFSDRDRVVGKAVERNIDGHDEVSH